MSEQDETVLFAHEERKRGLFAHEHGEPARGFWVSEQDETVLFAHEERKRVVMFE